MTRSSNTETLTDMEVQDARPVRERIVNAALELAQTIGVQGMSQARVAAAAGIRQSHLTYYFPTRADLIKATVYAIRDQMLEATRNAFRTADSTTDPVQALREFCLGEVCDLNKARLVLSLLVVAEQEPSLQQWQEEFMREDLGQWMAVYRQLGLDPRPEEVELFHTTYIGATLVAGSSDTEAARQRARRVVGMAFDRLLEASGYTPSQS